MAKDLTAALEAVEMPYSEIKQIAEDMLAETLNPINQYIELFQAGVNNMPVETLRDYLLQIQLKAFSISELRDKTLAKAQCAEAIKKEAYAKNYVGQDGTAAQRDANTTIAISENIVVELLYDLVADLVKTKVDQLHRIVDVLKSILMSRMQEFKFMNLGTSNDISATTNGKISLSE